MNYYTYHDKNNRIIFYGNDNLKLNKEKNETLLRTKKIIFGEKFNGLIDALKEIELIYDKKKLNIFPNHQNDDIFLTEIIFGRNFNQPVDNLLPVTILHLKFGTYFKQLINYLPKYLESLEFVSQSLFNHSIDLLPINLKILILGNDFNKEVNNLPSKLQKLIFGNDFNKSIELLPIGLKYLKLGENFNQPINNLPSTINHLVLGKYFNQTIEMLPSSIEILEFSLNSNFTQSFDNIPSSIKSIICDSELYQDKIRNRLKIFKKNNIHIYKIIEIRNKLISRQII